MTAELIVRSLDARRSGSCWMAKCPAHKDRNPSLSIREVDGKVLVHCFAGCSQKDVMDALKTLDLWSSGPKAHPTIVATYDYTNEYGNLLYQVLRYDPKDFKQRRPDGLGGWTWRRGDRQVLYRLPGVLEAPIVFVVEGEKDVETLREYGFVATTNAGGAKARWMPEYTECLRGREVILVPDNDLPGWKRANTIARSLLGIAARIRIFDLPTDTKDISDWFAAGHSETELIAKLEGVNAI